MKVRAFTLAEVLITLGIIGIVAAMTLPTLIQKQQEKVLINQLKVANNTLSNALLLAYKDYDTMQFWTDASSGAYTQVTQANFEKYFLPYFGLTIHRSTINLLLAIIQLPWKRIFQLQHLCHQVVMLRKQCAVGIREMCHAI